MIAALLQTVKSLAGRRTRVFLLAGHFSNGGSVMKKRAKLVDILAAEEWLHT